MYAAMNAAQHRLVGGGVVLDKYALLVFWAVARGSLERLAVRV